MKSHSMSVGACFDSPITNGYTEVLHGLGKMLLRVGRIYSFEAIHAKMSSFAVLHKQYKPLHRLWVLESVARR